MQTFNQALLELVRQGLITEEEALLTSGAPDDLKLGFRGIMRGSSSGELDMDFAADASKKGKRSASQQAPGASDSKISRGFDF
jgi:hypothetical protein